MEMFKWTKGRQEGCDYKKFTFIYFKLYKFGFDGYILKYEKDQILPEHVDPVNDGDHYRLNVGYGKSKFTCEKTIFTFKIGNISVYLFRPDLYKHSLRTYEKTTKLSLGFVKYKR